MSAARIDPASVAGAAFALAAMGPKCISDEEVGRLVDCFGPGPVHVALQVQARLLNEEAAALEAYGAIRAAKGAAQ